MHAPSIGFALLLATASAFGAQSVEDFHWSDSGRRLALHGDGEHVIVTAASPAPFLGLHAGDVVVAVDGHPLHAVGSLMQALRRSSAPVHLRVLRGDTRRDVVWTRAEYAPLLPSPPPVAPAPPPPPPAPRF